MCLTKETLILFLSFLPEDRITWAADQVELRAEVQTVIWRAAEPDRWCTTAPREKLRLRAAGV